MHLGAALLCGLLSAGLLALGTRPVLRRLPEPREDDGSPVSDKIAYRALSTRRFVTVSTVLSGVLTGGAASVLAPAAVPLWFVLGTLGLLLAGIDARTTWLPLGLSRLAWAAMAGATIVAAAIAAHSGDDPVDLLLRVLVGALVAGVLLGLVWRLSRGGLGFGDVRFAPLVGAATAAVSWPLVWWALVLGAVAGGVYGSVRLLRQRREPFPYAPALFAGGWLALALSLLG